MSFSLTERRKRVCP